LQLLSVRMEKPAERRGGIFTRSVTFLRNNKCYHQCHTMLSSSQMKTPNLIVQPDGGHSNR
jgi:hypothetical protein